jgi:hypothetical protein
MVVDEVGFGSFIISFFFVTWVHYVLLSFIICSIDFTERGTLPSDRIIRRSHLKLSFMKKISLLLSLGLILSSCQQLYYVSNIQNVPMFQDKNEFNLAGSYAVGNQSESGELQTAYSITNFLGITANYMRTQVGNYAQKDYVSGTNYDFAIGYFRPIGSKAVFEVYSGYGRNRQHHSYSHPEYNTSTGAFDYILDGDAYLKYRRIYLQPAFGLVADYFDVVVSARLNQLRYTYINYDIGASSDQLTMDLLDNKYQYILEPAITLRTGWRYIKVQFQASYAEYLNDTDDDGYDFVEGPHISCGFYLTLSHRWRKQE